MNRLGVMCRSEGYDGAVVDTVSFWCPLCLRFIAGKSGQLGVFFSLTDDQGVFGPFHVAAVSRYLPLFMLFCENSRYIITLPANRYPRGLSFTRADVLRKRWFLNALCEMTMVGLERVECLLTLLHHDNLRTMVGNLR